ncbi:hypothetical protein IPA_03640 [Ignicoccus pacificus DSM 13166]|uniref:Uncharacterized protein n=1 Tax=Ignicoccus pacificus DSM 13166 TaxID=940294 RepID=A0A977PLH1_9CREN|nr:hypothetical protein IPA_03640 [Ignicoccus pacificus DSM 13166]
MNWAMLALPPIAGSVAGYFVSKWVEGRVEKIVAFWAVWAGTATLIHVLLDLMPIVALAYPLLALATASFMVRGIRTHERKGRNR